MAIFWGCCRHITSNARLAGSLEPAGVASLATNRCLCHVSSASASSFAWQPTRGGGRRRDHADPSRALFAPMFQAFKIVVAGGSTRHLPIITRGDLCSHVWHSTDSEKKGRAYSPAPRFRTRKETCNALMRFQRQFVNGLGYPRQKLQSLQSFMRTSPISRWRPAK